MPNPNEPMSEAELQRLIVGYPLPLSTLARPARALFVARSVLTAFVLFAALPFRPVRKLFPRESRGREEFSLEKAAISYSLTEALLRSPIFPFGRTCLRRSLLLSHLLRRCGVNVYVAFGVDPAEGGWAGHSWLVLNGRPFLETDEETDAFVPMFLLPEREGRANRGSR